MKPSQSLSKILRTNVPARRLKLCAPIIGSAVAKDLSSPTLTMEHSISNNNANAGGDSQIAEMETFVLPIDMSAIVLREPHENNASRTDPADHIHILSARTRQHLHQIAEALRDSNVPVAFPTETVYGLGADATRSSAVRGIYRAKQRPSDNPLIVHVASMKQLRKLLSPAADATDDHQTQNDQYDPIPQIYLPLIERFWPGPLTVLLPLPSPSPFAPEVNAGLDTVGVRMPNSLLALAIIKYAGRPIAAPSANASGKPSPTNAAHVLEDMVGRIHMVIDGGDVSCEVGVESTVVDGLSSPPAILRPGGVSLEDIQSVPGWENCTKGYKDHNEKQIDGNTNGAGPRAPGMKYRHYSPKARVALFESGTGMPPPWLIQREAIDCPVGVIRTSCWPPGLDLEAHAFGQGPELLATLEAGMLPMLHLSRIPRTAELFVLSIFRPGGGARQVPVWDIGLGGNLADIARRLFASLRDLDAQGVGVIFVEGVDENQGHEAAAIMNRLRKAASG